MNPKYKEAAERAFPIPNNRPEIDYPEIQENYEMECRREGYIKACEHMEAAASELVRALEKIEKITKDCYKNETVTNIRDTIINALAAYPKQEEGKEKNTEGLAVELKRYVVEDLLKPANIDAPYLVIGGRSYTRRQFAKAINEETKDGLSVLGNLISLTIDILSRGKAPKQEEGKEAKEFAVGDRVTRGKINAFRYGKGVGTIVEKTECGRNKIKWDEKQRNGQQHSTIQSKFLVKIKPQP